MVAVALVYNLLFLCLARSLTERIDREPIVDRQLMLAGIITD